MHDDNSTKTKSPDTLTIAQVAERMGLSPRELQALRLRGLGPQIVQRGLSIHYDLAEVREIERHEVMSLVEDVLACPQPLVRLRTLLEGAGLPLSPLLQQGGCPSSPPSSAKAVSQPSPPPSPPPPRGESVAPSSTVPAQSSASCSPVSQRASRGPSLSNAPTAIASESTGPVTMPTEAWYLLHTKPRQEELALVNLERQGYPCFLPRWCREKMRGRKLSVVSEPMFPRYLFIRLDSGPQGKSWSALRSTLGVRQLVYFGSQTAKVDDSLIRLLKAKEQSLPTGGLFAAGEAVVITEGPYAGIEAIYQTQEAEQRSVLLLQILRQSVPLKIGTALLRKAG